MDRVANLAGKLIACHRNGRRVPVPAGADAPVSLAEGYAVQAAVAAGLGHQVGGYKVGLSPDGSAIFAPIYRSLIAPTGSTVSVRPFDRIGIELEFAFRFARQVPAKASLQDILAAIDRVHVAIELCETRYTTNDGVEKFIALADNQYNRGLILGTELIFDRGRGRDFKTPATRWLLNGKSSHENRASHPNGDPIAPLAVLPAIMADQNAGIQPGQYVITGSHNGNTWVKPDLRVEGQIDGFGKVDLTIAA